MNLRYVGSTVMIALFFLVSSCLADEYKDITLKNLMSDRDRDSLGIAKLSDQESENLRLLIIKMYKSGFQDGYDTAMKRCSTLTMPYQGNKDIVESKIDGEFSGWEGETIIKLVNGQIWQQTDYYYHYHYSFMPDILIYKSGSSYKAKVEGVERAVSVERLK